jgi:hypothetical protein
LLLASNINLLTHYAKGTLLFFYLKFTRAAYKTTISNLSFTVLYAVAYILYLALEEGSPLSSNRFCPFYLFNLSVESIFTIFQVMLILFILLQYINYYILILI